jgi:hypothetical protein
MSFCLTLGGVCPFSRAWVGFSRSPSFLPRHGWGLPVQPRFFLGMGGVCPLGRAFSSPWAGFPRSAALFLRHGRGFPARPRFLKSGLNTQAISRNFKILCKILHPKATFCTKMLFSKI